MRYLVLFFSIILVSSFSWAKPTELYWEDLAPKDYVIPDAPQLDHNKSMAQQSPNAPTLPELNGKEVKIPGFVVPLEGDDQTLTEFLLVPYFGACIHVPPPPSNQIVYVKFEKGVPVDSLYDAVWVHGTLSTEGWQGDIATVGYSMKGIGVTPFE
ncbi:DUF3299 domain-containing protein [Alteromonas sp. a30]|uniref:DUF3299 domain-containing protein n=1 Tax=Alteromonas sp. a30 TaxID=2730917 RepID=UPI002281ADEF|nr:DUF3299 domain-containing protein [Alteromonas sp. a30]MCY7295004.1 DUF3299 domain-containing protein [Alteromonas sp. a30]